MSITQKIQQFPPAPNSATDTPTEFNGKADAFVHHQADTYVTEVNTWATQANTLETEMNIIKTDIDNIVGTIPAGTIDDSVIANDKVWSSLKTSNIVESGTGYIKFANGVLICYGAVPLFFDVSQTDIFGTTSGDINRGKADVTYPIPFTYAPSCVSSGGNTGTLGIVMQGSTTVGTIYGFYASSVTPTAEYIAIGKWK